MIETELSGPEGLLVEPDGDMRGALLVLSGSSGRLEVERARVLASHGFVTVAMRWFGGVGQPPTPREVALESFGPSLDRLAGFSDRLGVVGTSFGAEAALLLGLVDRRIRVVAALAPTSVVWGTPDVGADGRPIAASKWTLGGEPLTFVPYLDQTTWTGPELRSACDLHAVSFDMFAEGVSAAAIAVENIEAEVLLAAGGDDQVWPAVMFAEEIRERRASFGRSTVVVSSDDAGHRVILPGENPPPARADLPRGGSAEADSEHGARVLDALMSLMSA